MLDQSCVVTMHAVARFLLEHSHLEESNQSPIQDFVANSLLLCRLESHHFCPKPKTIGSFPSHACAKETASHEPFPLRISRLPAVIALYGFLWVVYVVDDVSWVKYDTPWPIQQRYQEASKDHIMKLI
jgi:hypothetical protein